MRLSLEDREAEAIAEEVIASEKITTLPVCPITIAERKGLVVQPKQSRKPGVSGFLMKVGDQFGIQYATHIDNDGFKRFTVAHELGHYCIPGHPEILFPAGVFLHESRSGFISGNACERQADIFAATLLMPENLFQGAMKGAGEGFAAIDSLRKKCRTSITSTAIRYARFSDDPVAVIVSAGSQVDFCFMSRALEEIPRLGRLRKGSLLPPDSATASFNKDPLNVASGKQAAAFTMLDSWFDDAPSIEMNEDVVGLGSYGKTLTVLFTTEAVDDDDAFDDDVD